MSSCPDPNSDNGSGRAESELGSEHEEVAPDDSHGVLGSAERLRDAQPLPVHRSDLDPVEAGIANNANQLDYTQIISLNNSAAYLLKETAYAEISATGWANLLVDKYSIPYQQALADAEKLIEKLQEAGVLE